VTARIDLGDLSHLTDEDAELYAALYLERNRVSRGELARVRNARAEANRRPPTGFPTVVDDSVR
jgi:hypothetical protein